MSENIAQKNIEISEEQQKDIAIILPAYNESLTVAATICSFHKALPYARIYVVDNNSSDDTQALAKKALEDFGIAGAVIFEGRQGKGNAVRRAFLEIEAEVYLLADADCTYPADQAAEMVLPVLEGRADMVIGDRLSGGDYARENTRPMHNFGNSIVTKLVNILGQSNIVDTMTGYRALSRALVRTYPLIVEGFQIETDISIFAAQARFRCVEIPIRYVDRPEGSFSKLSTLHDGMRVLLTIFRVVRYYRPLFFFASLSLFFALVGLLLGIPVVFEYMDTGLVNKFPTAILAAALEILAATMLAAGLTLDGLAYQRRINFEAALFAQTKALYKK